MEMAGAHDGKKADEGIEHTSFHALDKSRMGRGFLHDRIGTDSQYEEAAGYDTREEGMREFANGIGIANQCEKIRHFSTAMVQDETSLVLLGLAIINIWSLSGFNMVLFAAGLTAVPEELYDAASVDGMDGAIDRFFGVTLPLLGPTLMFVLVTSTVTAFKVFDTVAVITRGGPRVASDVLLYTTYLESFSYLRMGPGAAMTVVFLVIILFFALLPARVLDKKVHS